jgi:hypothetical protein
MLSAPSAEEALPDEELYVRMFRGMPSVLSAWAGNGANAWIAGDGK